LFVLSAVPSLSQANTFLNAEQTPPGIHLVSAGGYWESVEDEGFYRVVVTASGVEHVVHQLFIQWLRSNSDTQEYELLRTVGVEELNQAQSNILNVETSFGDINAFEIIVSLGPRGNTAEIMTLIAHGDGTYVVVR
jgi:hypothetical protein